MSLEVSLGFMHPGKDSWAQETGAELAFLDTARWLPKAVGPVSSSTSHMSASPLRPRLCEVIGREQFLPI